MTTNAVVRQYGENLTATVRCWDGIADVQRTEGEWFCSACGRGGCRHSAAAESCLDDLVEP